jgi:hypothetical protein
MQLFSFPLAQSANIQLEIIVSASKIVKKINKMLTLFNKHTIALYIKHETILLISYRSCDINNIMAEFKKKTI